MRNFKLIFTFIVLGILFISCKESNSQVTVSNSKKTAIDSKKLQTASFNIDGMTCAIGCAKTIEKELIKTNGVQTAIVNFDKKEAIVSFDSSIHNSESLTKIVEATADGKTYKVSNMKSEINQPM